MHKIIQSHLIIESIHCMFIKGIPFLLPLSYLGLFFSFFFLLTLLELIFWALEIATTKLCIKLNHILFANY